MKDSTYITLSWNVEQIGDVIFACNDQGILFSGVTSANKLCMATLCIMHKVVVGLSSLQRAIDKH